MNDSPGKHVVDWLRHLWVPGLKRTSGHDRLSLVLREPLFQFIVLGCLVWVGVGYVRDRQNRYSIHIGQAEQSRIAATYAQQFGQLPTADQMQRLVDRYVREEVFLREGLALNLDKDDEIVRRRIVQKYEFLQTDLVVPDRPPADVLDQWFERNKLNYQTPERVAFTHVYFSVDRDGEEGAKARALIVLERLRQSKAARAPSLGDAFPGPSDVSALTPMEANRLFGKSELSEHLFKLPVEQWSGPYRSGYGWHAVYVTGHLQPELPPLTKVYDRVLSDYLDEQRQTLEAKMFQKLRSKYTIHYDGKPR